jgi:two-component system, chemotaxis family, sensor kinase CheA
MGTGWDTARYLELYLSEAREHLRQLSMDIVGFEKQPSVEQMDSMFRHAHSLKGMAGSLGFDASAQIAHALEEVLERHRSAGEPMARESVDFMLRSVDALVAHVKTLSAEGPQGILKVDASLVAPTKSPTQSDAKPARVEYSIKLKIATTSQQPQVRGFLVYRRLSGIGTVNGLSPPIDDIKRGQIPNRRITVELTTDRTDSEVRSLLESIAEVEIESIERSSPDRAATVVATTAPSKPAEQPTIELNRTVRIRTELLDRFLDSASELQLATSRFKAFSSSVFENERGNFAEASARLGALVRGLHDAVMSARMTPLAMITDQLPRVVRDAAAKRGRTVTMATSGAEVELDRAIVDALGEPLLHLVRNAVDHGIEPPEERRMRGKDTLGKITLAVARHRDQVRIDLSDDGRGIDGERLKLLAIEGGHISADAARTLGEHQALELIYLSGLSTTSLVNDISGRGVGMDVVKRSIESFGGSIEVASTRGEGTRFTLMLPITVSMARLLLVQVNGQRYGIPIGRVVGVMDLPPNTEPLSSSRRLLHFADSALRVFSLATLLHREPPHPSSTAAYVIVDNESQRLALEVDALLGQEEVVLKSLTRPLDLIAGLGGVAIFSDGVPTFVLDVPRLLPG